MKKRFPALILTLLLTLTFVLPFVQTALAAQDEPVPDGYTQDDSIPSDPIPDAPAPEDPAPSVPVPEDPVPSVPVPEDPVPSVPVPEDPVPSVPVPEDPVPSVPVPEDPVPSEPVPSVPVPDDYIAAVHTYSNGLPYYIMVNRAFCTVTVYTLDASGFYTVPVKAMICSVGREGCETPLGTYSLGWKSDWTFMVDGSYGQYTSRIVGGILFHSVCYYRRDPSSLMTHEYNGLGAPASLGCVRLQTVDAKWIFDNCAMGTYVTIYDGTYPGPLGKPARLVDYVAADHPAAGWDPTDSRANNPWRAILGDAAYPEVVAPFTPNPVGGNTGTAEPAPEPEPEPAPDAVCSHAEVLTMLWRAAGEPVSTAGVPIAMDETAQYAGALHWAAEKGMLDRSFRPDAPCTRAAAVTYIWQAFGSSKTGTAASFTDVDAGADFAAPVAWAVKQGIIGGTDAFSPYESCTRSQVQDFLSSAYPQ